MNDITVFGKQAKHPFYAFQPIESQIAYGIRTHSPTNGNEYGIPQRDCYACHATMNGAAIACSAHGFGRKID